jgi:hypothetical protein
MLAGEDGSPTTWPGEPLRTACRCNHRRHVLEHIIAKCEVVNESNGGMATDQGPKRPRAEFMRQMKRGPQGLVLGHQLWNLPHEQREWTPAKKRGTHARRRLDKKQGVKSVFTQLDNGAMELRHVGRKRRQLRVRQPPGEPKPRRNPNRDTY